MIATEMRMLRCLGVWVEILGNVRNKVIRSMVVDPIKEKQNERVTLDDFIMCNGDTDYYTNGK